MSVSNSKRPGESSLPFLALLLVSALGLYGMYDAAFVGVVSGQRLIYAAVVASCLTTIIAGVWQIRLLAREIVISAMLMGCIALWMIPVLSADRVISVYVAGDIASLTAPVGLLLAGAIFPGIFQSRASLALIGALLVLALLISVGLSGGSSSGRFEPPHNLLLALLWLLFLRVGGVGRWASAVLLTVALIATLRSGERASTVLWLFGGMYIIALAWSNRKLLVAMIPAGALAILLAGSLVQDMIVSALQETRFSLNVEGQVDDSILSRLNEAIDVINELRVHAQPINYLLGFGHGATFVPVYSSLRNAVDDVVHNIHIGPVLILYRYGLLGFSLYLFLLIRLFSSFLRQRQRARKGEVSSNELFFTFALAMYLLDGLVHNVLVDPAFSFALAGYLHFFCREGLEAVARVQLVRA